MFTALYYPHITISHDLVKNSLFLWDRLEYIVPESACDPTYEDESLRDAVHTIAVPHVPSPESRRAAEKAIFEVIQLPLPDWFFIKNVPEEQRYSIYLGKLGPTTCAMLSEKGLGETIYDSEFITSPAFGLTFMSILADACAGTQRRLVTDEVKSYEALDRYLATIGGAELGEFDTHSERLVTISLKIMNFKHLDIKALINIREKEKTASGAHIRELRHKYLKTIEEFSDKMADVANAGDKEEIERVFENEMKNDLELLRDELKDEAKKVFFSSEMLAAVIGAAGSLVAPVPASIGLALAGGALYRKNVEYRASRNKTLKGHSMSWLYAMRRLPVY